MIDAHRPIANNLSDDVIMNSWRQMLLQRELIQNPIQLAFSSGYLATNENFLPIHTEELAGITVRWFNLVGSVLLANDNPTFEGIVNILKSDEPGHNAKSQNWWAKLKDINPGIFTTSHSEYAYKQRYG
jgi:hypothetical protein